MEPEESAEAVRAICDHFGIGDDVTDEYDGMTAYQILVSTIVSQQISERTTRRICGELFSEFPDMERICNADPARLEEVLRASRHHAQKTRCIISATKAIVERFGGEVPDDPDELMSLPGVGRKTAACVLRYGYGRNTVIVDAHINRVAGRLGISDSRNADRTQKEIERTVPEELRGKLDRGFMALGRTYCRPKDPDCGGCPARPMCRHAKQSSPDEPRRGQGRPARLLTNEGHGAVPIRCNL